MDLGGWYSADAGREGSAHARLHPDKTARIIANAFTVAAASIANTLGDQMQNVYIHGNLDADPHILRSVKSGNARSIIDKSCWMQGDRTRYQREPNLA